jgi:hypothetical protein
MQELASSLINSNNLLLLSWRYKCARSHFGMPRSAWNSCAPLPASRTNPLAFFEGNKVSMSDGSDGYRASKSSTLGASSERYELCGDPIDLNASFSASNSAIRFSRRWRSSFRAELCCNNCPRWYLLSSSLLIADWIACSLRARYFLWSIRFWSRRFCASCIVSPQLFWQSC